MPEPTQRDPSLHVNAEFDVASEPGREREAMQRVADALRPLGLARLQLDLVKTAVAETALNAMEHGNGYRPELPVHVGCRATADSIVVTVEDQGQGGRIPQPGGVPDLEAKLAGLQSPRGWGLFLVRSMVDEMTVENEGDSQTVTLVWRLGSKPESS